jgi:protein phosphatase 1L
MRTVETVAHPGHGSVCSAGSGFGVIADPEVTTVNMAAGDKGWMVVCSDGLFVNEERGGGGGLDNNKVASIISEAGAVSADVMADTLVKAAIEAGSTDDVTVVCIPLSDLAA